MLRSYVYRKGAGAPETDAAPSVWGEVLEDPDAFLWVDCEEAGHEEVVRLSGAFKLHPLEIESLTRTGKRPKMFDYEDHLFLVLHSPVLQRRDRRIVAPELDIILGERFLVTCHDEPISCVTSLAERVEKSPEDTLGKGGTALLYSLMLDLVENYQPVLDQIGDLLAGLEERILRWPRPELLDELSQMKRQLLALRRVAIPQAETILLLSRDEISLIDKAMRVYFRDLHDRLSRVGDMVEMYRDLIGGARDTYLSVVSNKMNEVMQTLTIIATIMMPLTLIAGIYGMNFKFMPELQRPWAYPAVMSLMVVIAVVMIVIFRRKKWM